MYKHGKTYYEQEVDRIFANTQLARKPYSQLHRSKQFMQTNYAKKICITQIAEAAFLSPSHYIRIFKQVYGITPRQYLRDLRIAKAKQLLLDGSSATHACFEVGYESPTMFSTTFKRATGISPKKYQKMKLSNLEEVFQMQNSYSSLYRF